MNFQKGQLYISDGLVFEIIEVIRITKWCLTIQMKILNHLFMEDFIFDISSKELEEKMKLNIIKYLTDK